MKRYYVYIYMHNDIPIYVGKGTGRRAYEHLRIASSGKGNSRFYKALSKLLIAGDSPQVVIHMNRLTEGAALALEMMLIIKFGRSGFDLGGTLLNISPGGDEPPCHKGRRFIGRKSPSTKGKPGKKWAENDKARHAVTMKARMSDPAVRSKISVAKKGKPGPKLSDAAKLKVGDAHRGKTSKQKSESKKGSKNPLFGWKWFNNGEHARLFDPANVPEGWVKGRKLTPIKDKRSVDHASARHP